MTVSSGSVAAAFWKSPPGEHRWSLLAAALVLASLGLASLLKVSVARWAAAVCAVVAAVLVSDDLVRERLPALLPDPLPAAIRGALRDLIRAPERAKVFLFMAFLLGCLLLLVGRPRGVRIGAGVVLAAPLVVEIARAVAR